MESRLHIRVRAVVWECGDGQSDRQTHRRPSGHGQYTLRLGYASREVYQYNVHRVRKR